MNSQKHIRIFLAILVLILGSLACSLAGGPPTVGEVVVAKDLDADYKPIDPTSTYTSDDTVIAISVELQNMKTGNVVEVKYKLNGEDYDSLTATMDQDGSGYYGFTLTLEDGLLPGDYSADVYLDSQLVKTVTFNVVPSGPPAVLAVVTAKSLDENYKPIDPTSTYSAFETFQTSVQVKNLVIGSNITVKYSYAGEYVPELDTVLIADQAGSGYYGFTLTPPTEGFPAGDYTIDVYLDDVLVQTAYVTVE